MCCFLSASANRPLLTCVPRLSAYCVLSIGYVSFCKRL